MPPIQATRSNESQNKVMTAIAQIVEDTGKLRETIEAVNGRTQNLAASTEQIAASVTVILNTANDVKERLNLLVEASHSM